jgi:hypothetical protein
MKKLYIPILFGVLISACTSVKNIYTEDSISDKQVEKLVKNYLKEPEDTANSNKLIYAYNFILNDHLNKIDRLKHTNTLKAKEQLISAYSDLQSFYDFAASNESVRYLLQPKNVSSEILWAKQNAADAWYGYGEDLLAQNNWKSGRDAYQVFVKVNNWVPNYENTLGNLQIAKEMGIIHASLLPIRNDGFLQQAGYNNSKNSFYRQLLGDLTSSWSNSDRYRVYAAEDVYVWMWVNLLVTTVQEPLQRKLK